MVDDCETQIMAMLVRTYTQIGNFQIRKSGILKLRETEPLQDTVNKKKDFHYPPVEDLNYENHIVGVCWHSGWYGYNWIMSNGKRS